MITQEHLKKCINYNPETGIVTRLERPRSHFSDQAAYTNYHKHLGPITNISCRGYIRPKIDGKQYFLHQLIFLYMTGKIPEVCDHINQNKTDNRWSNLRACTMEENNKNMPMFRNNKSGITGVRFRRITISGKNYDYWISGISYKGEKIGLGSFKTIFEAACARKSAEIKYGYHTNHGGVKL